MQLQQGLLIQGIKIKIIVLHSKMKHKSKTMEVIRN